MRDALLACRHLPTPSHFDVLRRLLTSSKVSVCSKTRRMTTMTLNVYNPIHLSQR